MLPIFLDYFRLYNQFFLGLYTQLCFVFVDILGIKIILLPISNNLTLLKYYWNFWSWVTWFCKIEHNIYFYVVNWTYVSNIAQNLSSIVLVLCLYNTLHSDIFGKRTTYCIRSIGNEGFWLYSARVQGTLILFVIYIFK